ncbi:biotin/lipoyl-containing protein, partial [Corallococcus llansteffanensis]
MAVELKVPPLGESITEAVVGKWNKKQGDTVAADEPLVVLETDKVTIDVPSPAAGSIASIAFKEGDKVRVGEVLGTIEAGGAGAVAASPAVAAATPAPAAAAAPVSAAASDARITPTAKKMAEENRVDVGQLKGSGTGGRIVKE